MNKIFGLKVTNGVQNITNQQFPNDVILPTKVSKEEVLNHKEIIILYESLWKTSKF